MLRRNTRKFLRRKQRQQRQKPSTPILKSPREIQLMREAGRIVARVHALLRDAIKPGVSTCELDQIALDGLRRYGASSAFLGYRNYPAHICTSINHELVHGIPSKDRILRQGDIISIDVGSRYRGFVGDSAWTYAVDEINPTAKKLMQVTEDSLYEGIKHAVVGNQILDISRAIQQRVEQHNFYVVRRYMGHGVGRQMHEAPQVLNFASDNADGRIVLKPGMVLAIEPMVQIGTEDTLVLRDEWTVISKDRSLAAHFEHTVAITNNGPEILTCP